MTVKRSDLPQRYINALNRHDAKACSELYSEDAIYLGADGIKYEGRAAIYEFYAAGISDGTLRVSLGREVQTDNLLVFEVFVHNAPQGKHGQANALDFCELDEEGLIAHKAYYAPLPGSIEDE
jgi:ketosteroid isomerase-like protein